MKKNTFKLEEIFTPSQPAFYTYVERQSINKRLDRAIKTPGKQIIIYGFSGAGKTTILTNKLKEDKIKSITTRCIGNMSLRDIVIDAFNQLEVFYTSSVDKSDNDKIGGGLSASYFGVKASLSAETSGGMKHSSKRAVDLPITPQALVQFIGESGHCWVIEDFHKVDPKEKTQMAQIMKVFMDSSFSYPHLKIIAIGAVNTAREVVQYDPEMRNRISEIEVPLMNKDYLRNILNKGQKLLKVKIPDQIIDKIIAYSSGLPAVTHQLGYLLCEVNGITETHKSNKFFEIPIKSFEETLEEYLNESSDSFKAIFEHATRVIHKRKSENPSDILKAILYNDRDGVNISEIRETLQIWDKNYKGTSLKKYVEELTTPYRSEILRYNRESMKFYFSNPFIKAYCHSALKTDIQEQNNRSTKIDDFKTTLNRELGIAYDVFIKDFYDSEGFTMDLD